MIRALFSAAKRQRQMPGEKAVEKRKKIWVCFFFAGAFFLLPLPFCHNRFISSEFKICFH